MLHQGSNPEGYERRSLARVAHLGGMAASGVFGSFLLFAYLVIWGNREEISSPLLLATFFLIVSAFITALLILLFWFLPHKYAKLIAIGIVSYAMVALALDAILPLGIGELEEGTESAPAAPLWGSLVQVVGTMGLAAVIWWLPLPLMGRLGWTLVAVIVASTSIPLILQSTFTYQPPDAMAVEGNTPPYNIYHVVFDGYYGPWLQSAVKELNLDPITFVGFTHYQAARSNYWSTTISYNSFMTGTMYEPTRTFQEWLEYSEHDSLITDLREAGFKTSYLGLYQRIGGADIVQTEETELAGLARARGDFHTTLDLWALRAAPVGLRHVLFKEGSGPLGRRFAPMLSQAHAVDTGDDGDASDDGDNSGGRDMRTYRSFQQFLRFLDSDKQRPPAGEYVHLYLYPPHSPYQLDRWGSFIGESSYEEQVLLATDMMAMLLRKLKELDQFHNSFIILHSDHGSAKGVSKRYRDDPERNFTTIDDATNDLITRTNLQGVKGEAIDARLGALLLVKPPAKCGAEEAGKPLRVDQSLTQLKDLREFIVGVVSGDSRDCKFPSREFVDIQVGLRQVDAQGNRKAPEEFEELNVYRIHRNGNWEILPNIDFSYE